MTCYTNVSITSTGWHAKLTAYSREIFVFNLMSFLLLRSLCLFIFALRFLIVLVVLPIVRWDGCIRALTNDRLHIALLIVVYCLLLMTAVGWKIGFILYLLQCKERLLSRSHPTQLVLLLLSLLITHLDDGVLPVEAMLLKWIALLQIVLLHGTMQVLIMICQQLH